MLSEEFESEIDEILSGLSKINFTNCLHGFVVFKKNFELKLNHLDLHVKLKNSF